MFSVKFFIKRKFFIPKGAEKLVQLFDNINEAKTEESKKPGAFTYLIRNPLMAGGKQYLILGILISCLFGIT